MSQSLHQLTFSDLRVYVSATVKKAAKPSPAETPAVNRKSGLLRAATETKKEKKVSPYFSVKRKTEADEPEPDKLHAAEEPQADVLPCISPCGAAAEADEPEAPAEPPTSTRALAMLM